MAIQLLLADDSATIAKILGLALQSEDYAIRSAATADEADKALKSLPPELFLVDLDLPQKNGYQFSQQVKSDSRLSKTRVVLLASAFEPADPLKVQQCGADLVIAKPFDPADLRAKLRKLLELPPKFPPGSKVQGSAGGEVVSAPKTTTLPLAQESDGLPPPPDRTVMLDLSGDVALGAIEEPVLDLKLSSTTPPGGTMVFEPPQEAPPPFAPRASTAEAPPPPPVGFPPSGPVVEGPSAAELLLGMENPSQESRQDPIALLQEAPAAERPPPFAPLPSLEESPSSSNRPEELSPNAQALAAFFEAEIEGQNDSVPPSPAPATEDALSLPETEDFDSSLSSIDWSSDGPSLDGWQNPAKELSSSPPLERPKQPPNRPNAIEPRINEESPSHNRPVTAGLEAGGSFLFDTGGSNFRFADDYIEKITKSFTGSPNEMILGRDPGSPVQKKVFPQVSHDEKAAEGHHHRPVAWTDAESAKMERIVREEVQMAVREVLERVAWEVIPELAENMVKKELEKVMRQMEEGH